ncbi:MAG: Stk1 family PASTA domain-containing Ser/Thr kinase [Lachnospiraceae bacterium]|nr:Stk1 family PASTA domain-containing Ser/Thr kinase [Lachnospiraceae bacterium]
MQIMIKIGMLISDRYEIIEKAGTGGMADVYKAMDRRLNRFVAIKVLKQEFSTDTKFVTKFRAEAQSVAGLSHSNIVGVYDVGDEDGLHYIVMELVEGITLKKYIERKGRLDIREALGISIQIAQGLEAAHDNHIIHRDIKPQNIIISKEGKVKVTDFGIAKAASSNTITSNAMGSVHYISPEQARGGFSDEKSDIYSLGITMYEMLSGSVPFTGESTVAVALAHIQEEAVPLKQLQADIPNSVEMIVSKCMQKKPEMRYLNVTSLIDDLKQAVTDPDGDFVKINNLVNDSATIHMSDDEVRKIRTGRAVVVPKPDPKEDIDLPDIEKENEKDSDIDPKLEKAVVIGSIVAGVVLALIVIFIIVKVFFSGGSTSEEPENTPEPTATAVATFVPQDDEETGVELDDIKGMDKKDAIAYLDGLKLDLSIDTKEEESDEVEVGQVISTNPVAGTTINKGDSVTIIVSSGAPKIKVPDVSGYSASDAEEAVRDAGFTPKLSYDNSDTVDIDKVIKTIPEKDTEAEKESEVVIVLSKGRATKYVKVPKLSGLTKKQAKKALEKADLKLGNTTSNYSDSVAEKLVMAQSQPNGSEVEAGTTVDITLSLGPEVTYKYIGNLTISDNPFTDETQTGTIMFVLTQDGQTKVVNGGETVMNYYSFPLELTVEGWSESAGEIVMYVNGARFNAYHISFEKVAQ